MTKFVLKQTDIFKPPVTFRSSDMHPNSVYCAIGQIRNHNSNICSQGKISKLNKNVKNAKNAKIARIFRDFCNFVEISKADISVVSH